MLNKYRSKLSPAKERGSANSKLVDRSIPEEEAGWLLANSNMFSGLHDFKGHYEETWSKMTSLLNHPSLPFQYQARIFNCWLVSKRISHIFNRSSKLLTNQNDFSD